MDLNLTNSSLIELLIDFIDSILTASSTGLLLSGLDGGSAVSCSSVASVSLGCSVSILIISTFSSGCSVSTSSTLSITSIGNFYLKHLLNYQRLYH